MEKYEFRTLSPEELSEVYEVHMKRDFPPAERKPLKYLLEMTARNIYKPYGLFRDGTLISYAFYWSGGDCYMLLDYFAVIPEERNRGTGSAFLREMLERFCGDGRGIFGEVEFPGEGDEEERALRRRRLNFYLRSGMEQRGFCTKVFGVPYQILSCGPAVEDEALMEICRKIYRSVLSDTDCRRHVLVPWNPEGSE